MSHLLKKVMERAAERYVPLQVTLELTYRCNLSCRHCYSDVREGKELSLLELRDILDQLVAAGALYILFTGGEILIRSDFFDIATYARRRGLILLLLTNGTLIDVEGAQRIGELRPFLVGLSLYGATPATHDAITGKEGSFISTLGAAERLSALGVRVSLQALLMNSNVHEAVAIRALAASLGLPLHLSYELLPARSGSLEPRRYEVGPTQLCSYVEPAWLGRPLETPRRICHAGRSICSITPSGDVLPCLMAPLKLGNLRQESFARVWGTSPQLQCLRSIRTEDLLGCHQCSLQPFCQRCMGVALSETGSLTAPAPSACRQASLRAQLFRERGGDNG